MLDIKLSVQVLKVHNWLRVPQRFTVYREILKPERNDPTTSIKGLDYIDIPGLSEREYRITFETYKEGTIQTKVTFRNDVNRGVPILLHNI